MKKSIYSLLLFIFMLINFFTLNAQPYAFEWVNVYNNNQPIPSFTTDNDKNIYIISNFQNTINIGGNILTSNGASDFFIAKYDSNNVFIWIKQFGGTDYDKGTSIICDSNNDLIFTGYFSSTVTFGTSTLTALSFFTDIFIAKYDSSGNFIWVEQAGGGNCNTDANLGKSLALDSYENIYLAGDFCDTMLIGDTMIISADYLGPTNTGFIAKYDNSGNFIWVNASPNISSYESVSVDNNNNPHITGNIGYPYEYTALYVSKYNEYGSQLWEKMSDYNSTYPVSFGHAIANDSYNNVYVALNNNGTMDLDAISVTHGNYVIKFDTNGNSIWCKNIGGFPGTYPCSVSTFNNRIFIASFFYNSISLGSFNLNTTGVFDMLVAEMDTGGNFIWAKQIEGNNNSEHYGHFIKAISEEEILISGAIRDTAYFDTIPVFNTNYNISILAKLIPDSTSGFIWFDNNADINIFPNPSQDFVNISIEKEQISMIKIYSADGQLIFIKESGKKSDQIDVSDFPMGLYFINIITKDHYYIKKLIKD